MMVKIQEIVRRKNALHLTMITKDGVADNKHARELIDSEKQFEHLM
jgi:hypothetical protein